MTQTVAGARTRSLNSTPQGREPNAGSGVTIWLTGLSGAGKSTIAVALTQRLNALGRRTEVLDGDEVRENLSKGLGFSREDRDTNIRRIAYVAKLLTRNDVIVISAAISPYAAARAHARASVGEFLEVYVNASLETCIERDPKGLYRKAIAGSLPAFTGISDPYEAPSHPDLELLTDHESVQQSVDRILALLVERGYTSAEATLNATR